MITLITGTPGSGKTLYAVTKILEYVEQNKNLLEQGKEPRMIYANIDGLNIDGVEPAPVDWRDTPDGSVIFYDEIQQLEPYKKSRFDNEICDGLQVHRHTGHDIYGITQFPVLLHTNFRAVVGMHQHLHRGWGLTAATVFNWAYCVDAPNAPSNKKLAEHTFRFNYPKDVYKYYKSATIHTHKARLPKKMFAIVFFIILFGYFAFNQLFNKDNFFSSLYGGSKKEAPQSDNTQSTVQLSVENTNNDSQNKPVQGDVTPIQGQPNATQPTTHNQANNAPYAQNNAYPPPPPTQYELEQKYLPAYTVEVANIDTVRPAIVAQMGDTCIAYNQFGDKLNIDDKLCKSMLKEVGIKPKARTIFNQYNNNQYNNQPITAENQPTPHQQDTLTQQNVETVENVQ